MSNKNNDNKSQGCLSTVIGKDTPSKRAGLTYTALAVALLLVSLVFSMIPRDVDAPKPQWFIYLSFLAAPVAFLAATVWYFSYTKTPVKKFLKERVCHPKYYLVALLLQVGLLSLGELNGLFLRFLEKFGYAGDDIQLPNLSGFGFVGALLAIAVLPSIMEELFFRGVFLRETKGFSTWGRVLLCGGLFALYHQNPAQTVYQFICGSCFALIAIRANSFFPTVVSHFINNGLILTLQKCGVESYPKGAYIAMLCVSGVCLVSALIYLTLFDKKRGEEKETETEKGSYVQFFAGAAIGIATFAIFWVTTLITGF